MNRFATATLSACLLFGAASAWSQDAVKKDDPAMSRDMTVQDCKDYMVMSKKDAKKDDSMSKMDAMCADMLKKDAMKKDAMKRDDAVKK